MKVSSSKSSGSSQTSSYANDAGHESDTEYSNGSGSNGHTESHVGCSIKSLPGRLLEKAAQVATDINPVNAPVFGSLAEISVAASVLDPQFLTVLVGKYWGPSPRKLTVSFMETTATDLRKRILSHMNAWTKTACISFVETNGTGNVRIARGGSGGYWSYLGTDVMLIPASRQTMNLQNFTMNTPDSEFFRVVRHETGHTLGFPHEHMRKELIARIDPQKAYEYFLRTQGWNKQTVDQQVLTALDDRTIIGTPPDQTSIMCYQLPGSITRDGQPIPGGRDINATDYAFAGRIYPKPGHSTQTEDGAGEFEKTDDWGEEEDVQDEQLESAIQETMV